MGHEMRKCEFDDKTLKESADMIRSAADNHRENHRDRGVIV